MHLSAFLGRTNFMGSQYMLLSTFAFTSLCASVHICICWSMCLSLSFSFFLCDDSPTSGLECRCSCMYVCICVFVSNSPPICMLSKGHLMLHESTLLRICTCINTYSRVDTDKHRLYTYIALHTYWYGYIYVALWIYI